MAKASHLTSPWTLLKGSGLHGAGHYLHAFAQRWPRTYLALVGLLACLGYVYLAAFPTVAVILLLDLPSAVRGAASAAAWGIAAGKALAAGLAILLTYQLARIRFPLPGRHPVPANAAPALFQLITELRLAYRCPTIHRVCLKSDFVIELVRTPVCSFPLRHTNTLLIGLPVLLCLSPQQFKTALARKIGQFSLMQNPLTGRIYYLRQIWKQFRKVALTGSTPGHWALDAFFSWYSPLFWHLSSCAARSDEREADSYALDIVSDVDVLDSMFAMDLWRRFVEEKFWPAVYASEKACYTPFAEMEAVVREGIDRKDAERWLNEACSPHADSGQAMPPLHERMAAIGHARCFLPAAPKQSAASLYLGTSVHDFMARIDREWFRTALRREKPPSTPGKPGAPEPNDRRIQILREHVRKADLSNSEALEYALLAERYLDPPRAAALQKDLLARNSSNPRLHFVVGRFLLSCRDPAGVAALQTAMRLDRTCIAPARRVIADFLSMRKNTSG